MVGFSFFILWRARYFHDRETERFKVVFTALGGSSNASAC